MCFFCFVIYFIFFPTRNISTVERKPEKQLIVRHIARVKSTISTRRRRVFFPSFKIINIPIHQNQPKKQRRTEPKTTTILIITQSSNTDSRSRSRRRRRRVYTCSWACYNEKEGKTFSKEIFRWSADINFEGTEICSFPIHFGKKTNKVEGREFGVIELLLLLLLVVIFYI